MADFLASPVWDSASREITQPWGPTTLTIEPWWPEKNCHWHCGIDIGLVTGTPLKAARAGQVKIVSYGLLVIAVSAHEADCYVHIDRAVVSPGQWVKQYQLVAYSGAKIPAGGSLTGPHLHFEVQTGTLNIPATSLNPISVLVGGNDDMTADESKTLYLCLTLIRNLYFALGLPVVNPDDPKTAKSPVLADLKTAIAGISGGGLNAAQTAQLADIQTRVGALQTSLKSGLKAT
jgi:murein DD-endopeptidase MepM/ murein hydrolase activator NlpD